MTSQDNIQDELNGLNSQLPPENKPVPFSVPEGYFEGLASNILNKVKAMDAAQPVSDEIASLSPLLAGISRQMPFSVPDGYFGTLIETLPILVNDQEDSVVLSFIDKAMPYHVPSGYFTRFPEQVLGKVTHHSAKIIPIQRSKWMRLAVAAAVTGIVAVSGFFYFNGKGSGSQMASVAQEVKGVSTSELDNFIKNSDVNVMHAATAQNISVETSVKEMVNDVSNNDLDNFLKQIPNDDDLAIN